MKRQAGFTLIELLVSMTLLGLLLVLLLGGLRFGSRAWERGTAVSDAGETVRGVQSLLRGEVERACPRLVPSGQPQAPARLRFDGDADSLRFLGPAPGSMGGASCVPIVLRVRDDGAGQRLSLNVNGRTTDVLRGASAIGFAYLPQSGGWRDGWTRQPTLPALVRVRVRFPPGDSRIWPELFITPRISAEADCTYDPATKSCRGT